MSVPRPPLSDYSHYKSYGSRYTDFVRPFYYHTNIYQFDHPGECMQFTKNLIQTNRIDRRLPDSQLTDIESELRTLNTKLSKLPQDRALNHYPPVQTNPNECKQKIITHDNQWWNGTVYQNK